jgi:hypothetical protein
MKTMQEIKHLCFVVWHALIDPHALLVYLGAGIALSPEFIAGTTAIVKLAGALVGLLVVCLSAYLQFIKIKKEKKGN